MRRYETTIILDPDISEENRGSFLEKTSDLIPNNSGVLLLQEEWGNKKLAYEIKKKNRGHYIRVDFCGSGPLVDELERSFRIDDRVLKYMTVLLDKEADPEKILEEMAAEANDEIQESPEEAAEPEVAATEDSSEETKEATSTEPEASAPEKEKEE